EVPRAEEVILRAGAGDRWRRLAVDEEHVVAFAPPEVLVLENRHRDADEVAPPGCFHPHVVVFSAKVRLLVDACVSIPLPIHRPSTSAARASSGEMARAWKS